MRSDITPTLAKWGLGGNQFTAPVGGANAPVAALGWTWQFMTTTTKPIATGAISPQRLLLPSKDVVDAKLYVIWSDLGNISGAKKKVGFLLGIEQQQVDTDRYIGNTLSGRPDSWSVNSNGKDVDWKVAGAPELDPTTTFPLMQWGVGYESVPNQASSADRFHKTQMRMLRTNGTAILPDANFSLRGLSESIGGKYVVGGVYIWRMKGLPATAVLADGLYDGDGDGAKDTDDYGDDVYVWGIIAEFQ